MNTLLRYSLFRFAVSALLLGCLCGCVPTGVWLPDSSGYLYTAGKDGTHLMVYDVAKGTARFLVKSDKWGAAVPAVSPDGKQIGLARFTQLGEAPRVQITVYDLSGKEVQRSESFPWKDPQQAFESDGPKPQPQLYWSPSGDKLLLLAGDRPTIYDLKKKTQTRLLERLPMVIGNKLSRPDGKGFLLGGGSLHYIDWSGEDNKIALKNFTLNADQDVNLAAMALAPHIYSTKWDGDAALIRWSTRQMRIDTKKLEATLEEVKAEQTADKKTIQQSFSFGKDGPTVRVVELVARDFDNKNERTDGGYGQFRIELLKPGEAKPKVLVEKFAGCTQLLPSPNQKLLVIECGVSPFQEKAALKRLILLVNARGEVLTEIDALKTPAQE